MALGGRLGERREAMERARSPGSSITRWARGRSGVCAEWTLPGVARNCANGEALGYSQAARIGHDPVSGSDPLDGNEPKREAHGCRCGRPRHFALERGSLTMMIKRPVVRPEAHAVLPCLGGEFWR